MERKTVLATAVAAALGVAIGAPAMAATTPPPTYASEISLGSSGAAALTVNSSPALTGTLGFGVSASSNVFLRFDLKSGATFSSSAAPALTVKNTAGTGTQSGTVVSGGPGANYVIFQITAPTGGYTQKAAYTLSAGGSVDVTSTSGSVGLAYGEYSSAPDASNQTNALSSSSSTLLDFAQTLMFKANSSGTGKIDVTTNNTKFVSGTKAAVGEITMLGNTAGHLMANGSSIVATGGNPMVASTSSKSVLVVSGDFSAAPQTASGAFAGSGVTLNTKSDCTGTGVLASKVTSTQAMFAIGNSQYTSPEYVCYTVTGKTPIQFGVTYTAKYEPTAATGYTLPASFTQTLGTLETTGATATVLNIPRGATGGDQPYIRIYNTSSMSGPIRGTLYAQDGSVLYSGVLVQSLAPGAVQVLTAQDLQNLAGSSWTGRAYLNVFGQIPSMDVQALIRTPNGTLVNMSSKAPNN